MNGFGENKGLLEELDDKVNRLLIETRDENFANYLRGFRQRLIQQKYQADLLAEELNRNCAIYDRLNTAHYQPQMTEQPRQVTEQPRQVQPAQAQAARTVVQNQYFNLLDGTGKQPTVGRFSEGTAGNANSAIASERQAVQTKSAVTTCEQKVQAAYPVTAAVKPKQTEFAIGAFVLSIVGGIFLLAALVTFGMTLAGNLGKGICLYTVCAIILAVSEILVYRRLPMLGKVFTSIALGGLFLTTLICYGRWHLFGDVWKASFTDEWIALGITVAIVGGAVALSRKRDAIVYRIVGLLGGYLCFLVVEGIEWHMTLSPALIALVLVMNLLVVIFPIRKYRAAFHITHLAVNAVFTFVYAVIFTYNETAEPWQTGLLVVGMLLFQQFLLGRQFAGQQDGSVPVTAITFYHMANVLFAFMLPFMVLSEDASLRFGLDAVMLMAVCAVHLVAILVMKLCKVDGVQHIYTGMAFMTVWMSIFFDDNIPGAVSLLVFLAATKLLTLRKKASVTYRVDDIVLTVLNCILLLDEQAQLFPVSGDVENMVLAGILLLGAVISILFIHYWQTAFESIITAALAIQAVLYLPTILKLPVAVGILLSGILAFNHVKRWQGKNILIYNILALLGQAVCFLMLTNPIYRNANLTYLCMLIFGIATIVFTLQEQCHMNFKGKYMVLAVFLTYMALVFKTTMPFVNSILLMAIALTCVGIGFVRERKSVRLYGLILALLVCAKLVLYDFFKAPTLQKTVLFFIVGIIALIIAAIYIILEKRSNHSQS